MPTIRTPSSAGSDHRARFAATRWSLVRIAGNWRAGTDARLAMEELMRDYWFPLYAYLRRQGQSPEDAQDLLQGFFTRVLEKDSLAAADQDRGRFRSFLLACLQHYVLNELDKSRAQKRGGAANQYISLDALDAEARYAVEPADHRTPERLFEQQWALQILDQVLLRLREHYEKQGKVELFEVLKNSLMSSVSSQSHRELATQLNMAEGTVTVAAHRLRRRFRELLREEIAHTVAEPELVDEEIRYLLGCL